MSGETTTEQLAEIEGQGESTPATEYTPPEGWRVLAVGEVLRDGDVTVRADGYQYPTERVGSVVGPKQRYIRPIESEPEPEPQPESEPVQVREGRWRTRNGLVKDVTAMPKDHEDFAAAYPWWDGVSTWRNDGRWLAGGSTMDLLEYLGPIEPDKTQELETKTQELPDKTQELPEYTPPEGWRVLRYGELLQPGDQWVNWEGTVSRPDIQHGDGATVSGGRYIRNIDIELQTVKAQLAAVKAELASVAADRQRLLIELDAAQQVSAAIADRFQEGWNQGTARAIETIIAWLQPIRLADSAYLANATMQHLPQIMRHLTGLDSHAID